MQKQSTYTNNKNFLPKLAVGDRNINKIITKIWVYIFIVCCCHSIGTTCWSKCRLYPCRSRVRSKRFKSGDSAAFSKTELRADHFMANFFVRILAYGFHSERYIGFWRANLASVLSLETLYTFFIWVYNKALVYANKATTLEEFRSNNACEIAVRFIEKKNSCQDFIGKPFRSLLQYHT